MSTIFESKSYKAYLAKRLSSTGENRGKRTRLAEQLGCQPAHVTQVLGGGTHFSLEYAVVIDRFLGHSADESRYFLLMVHRDRAGTKALRQYYESQMEEIQEKRSDVRKRLEVEGNVLSEFHATYYSSWIYAAVHVMLSVPRFQNPATLADYLKLPLDELHAILIFLESAGMAKRNGARWEITKTRIHLGTESPYLSRHHTNWRLRAVQSSERRRREDLHYSAIFTLSEEDVRKVKEIFLRSLKEAEDVLVQSPEETAFGIGLDFFRV